MPDGQSISAATLKFGGILHLCGESSLTSSVFRVRLDTTCLWDKLDPNPRVPKTVLNKLVRDLEYVWRP
jgi:hypothetical protein